MIPTYKLTGEVWEISGRGLVHTAILTCSCKRDDLTNLIGKYVNGKKILGIESFAIEELKEGYGIGLLT